MQSIVIVTDVIDPHADRVVSYLTAHYQPVVRLNTTVIPFFLDIDLTLGADAEMSGEVVITNNGRSLRLEDIRSVWWRRPGVVRLPDSIPPTSQAFIRTEFAHALDSMWALTDAYWMSRAQCIRDASYKPEQLARARTRGFETPRTLVTTRRTEAQEFLERCKGRIVYKVLGGALMRPPPAGDPTPHRPVPTTPVSIEMLSTDDLGPAPCMLQERVPKRLDIRVTIIGDEVFAASIQVDDARDDSPDWRTAGQAVRISAHALPDSIGAASREFVRSYGLTYGALDFILTRDDKYVFLENNPVGQFLFVQQRAPELRMLEALADCLVRGAN